jgi:hypothetical protein
MSPPKDPKRQFKVGVVIAATEVLTGSIFLLICNLFIRLQNRLCHELISKSPFGSRYGLTISGLSLGVIIPDFHRYSGFAMNVTTQSL